MGGGRDKRKKAKPKTPGAGAEKTARKTQKNEAKAEQRVMKKAQVTRTSVSQPCTCLKSAALQCPLVTGQMATSRTSECAVGAGW
jgi:hypothetical protein